MSNLRIRRILHQDLAGYIQSEEYQTSPYIAISQHRGISHIHNPRAKPTDLVLVLVYEEAEMVAYLGVLPDELHFLKEHGNHQIERAGWLSCMWVNPKMRGRGIAKILINTVFEAWEHRILVTEFTPAAKGLYDSTQQFLDLAKPVGIRGYRRLNLSYLLPSKNPEKWQKWAWALRLADASFNLFNDLLLAFQPKACPKFSYVEAVDEEAWQLIKSIRPREELLRRQNTDYQWIVKHPWLLNAALENEESRRYHFSSVAKEFAFLNVKIWNAQNELIGFLLLSVRDKNLKIPYAYFKPEALEQVVQVLNFHLNQLNLNMLSVFHPNLVAYYQGNKSPFFVKRSLNRHYIISKVFEKQLNTQKTILLQDGDADAVFT